MSIILHVMHTSNAVLFLKYYYFCYSFNARIVKKKKTKWVYKIRVDYMFVYCLNVTIDVWYKRGRDYFTNS